MATDELLLVGALFKATDKRQLEEICDARGEDVSSFVRRAVKKELAALGYLTEAECKALGMEECG